MESTTIISRKLYRHHGTEGPRHDPYGYEQFEMDTTYKYYNSTNEIEMVAHLGLLEYYRINGNDVSLDDFEKALGTSLKTWCKSINKSLEPPSRCPDCNERLESSSGFVGEEMLYCPNGHGIFWSEEVTESMIENY